MPTPTTRRVGLIAAAAVLTVTGMFTGASSAAAGTNGQQVVIATHYSDQIQVCGPSQGSDLSVCHDWMASPDKWTKVPGWWFKGKVWIHGHRQDNNGTIDDEWRLASCDVPVSQADDWFWCDTYNQL
ncbi:hypothetical protein [Streptomyces sp. NBC_00203]|uniref:hypothetical protein n=1 Tax=Streptomyces sp. NBC_00203 TaxID=2975680 RepID=UPI003253E900